MKIKLFKMGMLHTNCYVASEDKDAVIIDPPMYSREVADYIEENKLEVRAILLTHGHFDHALGSPEFSKKYGVKVYMSKDDRDLLFDCTKDGAYVVGVSFKAPEFPPLEYAADGDELTFGKLKFRVISTPGHTAGGLSYYNEADGVLFSGDTLFHSCVGRSDLYSSSTEDLVHSIREKLYKLPDSTKVYCGHGDFTDIGFEKKNNLYIPE